MTDLVLWAGPVAKFQIQGATVPGAKEHFFGCRGDVTEKFPHCPTLANSWLDGAGRRLPRLLASIGLSEADVDKIYLGAFSAGGSAWKRLLLHPADRARITAVMLHDATYSDGSSKNPKPIEGFARYALDVMGDPSKLFVATSSSSPNGARGSGDEVLGATRQDIENRSGVTFEAGGTVPVSDQPVELHTSPSGNVIFATYGSKGGGHGYHPKMAPEYWQQVLQPWIAGAPGPGPGPPGPPPLVPPPLPRGENQLRTVASFLIGTTLGYGAVLVVERMMERA